MLIAAALTLTACGQAPSAAGRSEVAQGGPGFLDAGARTAKYGTDALPDVFPRTITHAMGKTMLSKKPTRVVVLDTGELDNAAPLWPTLTAVKAGHAKPVAAETWYLGLGVLAANAVLTDLRTTLAA